MSKEKAALVAELVEQHVAAHPPKGTSLSAEAVLYTAGRLLLLQAAKSAPSKVRVLSRDEMTKFAACLFVLLVQEHVYHRKRTVLGLPALTVLKILLTYEAQVEPDALLRMIETVDRRGTCSSMARLPGFMNRLRSLYHFRRPERMLSIAEEHDTHESNEEIQALSEELGKFEGNERLPPENSHHSILPCAQTLVTAGSTD
jgi:hypothetical protein